MTAGVLAIASPALAAQVTISDPAGDSAGPGLDITSATIDNRDYAVVVTASFVEDHKGTVIVAVDTRGRLPVRIISEHPRSGADKTYLLGRSRELPCDGLTSSWDRGAAEIRLRMPSRCLNDGNYGAIRSWVLTEPLGDGSDVDLAPDGAELTDWISRG